MFSAHDVAAYVIGKLGRVTTMKLQKLIYYAQAWSLVWDDRLLFDETIEAWANGPVVRELFEVHRGQFEVTTWPAGNPDVLDEDARDTIDAVLEFYGKHNSQWLSDLTHSEQPWQLARRGLGEGERGNKTISAASMLEYYSSIDGEE